jgi:hypothetical protein
MNRVGFLSVVGGALTWLGALRIAQVEPPSKDVDVWAVVLDFVAGDGVKTTAVVSIFATQSDAELFIKAKDGQVFPVGERKWAGLRSTPMKLSWRECRALYAQVGAKLPV